MAKIPEPIASFRTTITNKITSTATTILIDSVTDDDGVSMNGKILGFVIDKGKAEEEYILGTVDYSNSQLTSVTRGLSVSDGATSTANNKFAHRKKASIEVSDHPYITLLARLMNGTDGIDPSYRPKLSSDVNTTDDKQFVTAAQLNRAAMAGVTSSRVLVEATAGETVAAGNLIYFKTSDGRWWLCDADTAATVDNVILGIAQGAGTAGNAITGGSLLWGVDSNQSGRTLGAVQYASNTAGGISESVGTVEVTIGQAKSTTEIYFYPRLNQQITEDQQDALAGSSGTPSASNKFVTAGDENRNTGVVHYGASVVGTDAYAITPSPAITSYVAGQVFAVKADVANIGACTLAVSGLPSPKAIKMVDGSDPFTGYIAAGSIFVVRYDGTNMMLMSTPAALLSGDAHAVHWHDELYNTESETSSGMYFRGDLNDGLTATQNGTGTVTRSMVATRLFVTAIGDDGMLSSSDVVPNFSDLTDGGDFDEDYSYAIAFSAKFSAITEQDFFYGIVAAALAEAPANATLTTRHVAFMIEDGTIYASVADGTTQSRTDVSSGITLTNFNEFRFEFTGNGSALFYINGTLVATKATNTPVDGTATVEFRAALTGVGANDKAVFIKHPFSIKVSNVS